MAACIQIGNLFVVLPVSSVDGGFPFVDIFRRVALRFTGLAGLSNREPPSEILSSKKGFILTAIPSDSALRASSGCFLEDSIPVLLLPDTDPSVVAVSRHPLQTTLSKLHRPRMNGLNLASSAGAVPIGTLRLPVLKANADRIVAFPAIACIV